MQDAPLALVRTADLEAAIDLANAFAPEHLELACADAERAGRARARERLRVRGRRRRRGLRRLRGGLQPRAADGRRRTLLRTARAQAIFGAARRWYGCPRRRRGRSRRTSASVARAEGFPVHAESAEARADTPGQLRRTPDGHHDTTARRRDRALHQGDAASACALALDGAGECSRSTGVGFLDHMLDLLARHARLDLDVDATGDLETGTHHTTEDIGIVLGQALDRALGDRSGIARYGDATVPMDEALGRVRDRRLRPALLRVRGLDPGGHDRRLGDRARSRSSSARSPTTRG